MKKIVVNILLILACCILFVFFCLYLNDLVSLIKHALYDNQYFIRYIVFSFLNLMGVGSLIAVLIIFNKNETEILKTTIKENLSERRKAKADRAEANKQAKIEQLQAKLDELKKD